MRWVQNPRLESRMKEFDPHFFCDRFPKAPFTFIRGGDDARFGVLPDCTMDANKNASALLVEWEGAGHDDQPATINIGLGNACLTFDVRLLDRLYYTIGFITGIEPPPHERDGMALPFDAGSVPGSPVPSEFSRSSFDSTIEDQHASPPESLEVPTKVQFEANYLRILFRVAVPFFDDQGHMIKPGRCNRPVLRDDSFAIELVGLNVQNVQNEATVEEDVCNALTTASHHRACVNEIILYVVQVRHDPVALLWLGCNSETSSKVCIDFRVRNLRMAEGGVCTATANLPASASVHRSALSPFGERFTNYEGSTENPQYAQDDDESKEYTAFTRNRAEMDCTMSVPVLRGHMCHDSFQALYSVLLDFSMFEPWAPDAAVPNAATTGASMHSASGDDTSDEDEESLAGSMFAGVAGDGMSESKIDSPANRGALRRANHISFLTIAVCAETAAITLDEASGYKLVLGLEGVRILSVVEHHGTQDAVVTVHITDVELHEQTSADEDLVPVIRRFHLNRRAFRNDPNHAPTMFSLSTRVGVINKTGLKVNTVAASLTRFRLNHRVMPAGNNWLLRLIDWMELVDPVWEGYIPAPRMTKLHLHFWEPLIGYAVGPLEVELTTRHLLVMTNIVPGNQDLVQFTY